MTKGLARLRQILILAMRVLAVATLVFAASRPLAGGWIGLSGGRADTLVILLDRSASMEQRNLETGESKRSTALDRIAELIETTGHASEIVLIDSATLSPVTLTDAQALRDLPETAPTATNADIPAMLRKAADYLATNESGRTDIWLASDLRQSDWKPDRANGNPSAPTSRPGTRCASSFSPFPPPTAKTRPLAIRSVKRQRSPDGLRLVMDLVSAPSRTVPPTPRSGRARRDLPQWDAHGGELHHFRPELVLLGHTPFRSDPATSAGGDASIFPRTTMRPTTPPFCLRRTRPPQDRDPQRRRADRRSDPRRRLRRDRGGRDLRGAGPRHRRGRPDPVGRDRPALLARAPSRPRARPRRPSCNSMSRPDAASSSFPARRCAGPDSSA